MEVRNIKDAEQALNETEKNLGWHYCRYYARQLRNNNEDYSNDVRCDCVMEIKELRKL